MPFDSEFELDITRVEEAEYRWSTMNWDPSSDIEPLKSDFSRIVSEQTEYTYLTNRAAGVTASVNAKRTHGK